MWMTRFRCESSKKKPNKLQEITNMLWFLRRGNSITYMIFYFHSWSLVSNYLKFFLCFHYFVRKIIICVWWTWRNSALQINIDWLVLKGNVWRQNIPIASQPLVIVPAQPFHSGRISMYWYGNFQFTELDARWFIFSVTVYYSRKRSYYT